MAATLADIRTALKTRMSTVTGLRCYDTAPDQPQYPCAVVIPTGADFDTAMGRGIDTYTFDVVVMVQGQSDRVGQANLDALISGAGSQSIRTAVFTDQTLGGVVDTAHVATMSAYGADQLPDGNRFFTATLEVVVHTRGV